MRRLPSGFGSGSVSLNTAAFSSDNGHQAPHISSSGSAGAQLVPNAAGVPMIIPGATTEMIQGLTAVRTAQVKAGISNS